MKFFDWQFDGGFRTAVVAIVGAALWTSGAGAQQTSSAAGEKFLGNVWSAPQIQDFTRYWDQVTPENAGKWGPMEGTRGQINWGPLDQAYALAKDNGFPFRFHVLVWGNQQPAWLEALPAEEQVAAVRRRFAAVAERYPDIDYLEVVNEPMNDPPRKRHENDVGSGDYYEALGGAGSTGWDWVLTAFRMARETFPATRLVLNEYSVTSSREATERYLGLVRLLQAENLIDVIGVQGHAFATRVPAEVTRGNLDLLAATGLPIQVTEFDIDGPTDEEQLAEYQRVFPTFWDHPAVIGVTLWGWRPGLWRTRQGAYLVREDGSHRPAFDWLLQYTGRNGHQVGPREE
jgi:endo-1,4-beta-xylanase